MDGWKLECMNVRVNQQTYSWMEVSTDRWRIELIDFWLDAWINRMNGCLDEGLDEWKLGWIGAWMNK